MKFAYARLVEALCAATQGDRDRFVRSLAARDAQTLFSHAARHKVAPLLLGALAEYRVQDPALRDLRALLQRYAGNSLTTAGATIAQLDAIVETLTADQIPHILLKTAGRLYAGEPRARWNFIADIDLLVPRECAQRAADVLIARGYQWQTDALTAEGYRRNHHHLAPLDAPHGGKTVEVHVALALPTMFTTRSDWAALRGYTHQPRRERTFTYTFNAAGRALHYMIHGVGLYRLADAVLLAQELRKQPRLLSELTAVAKRDGLQRIPMLAVLQLAARIAGSDIMLDPEADRYAEWALWREDLPKLYRTRANLVDAWFANGGRMRGPATALAFPPQRAYSGRRVPAVTRYKAIAGRVLAGLALSGRYGFVRHAGRR